MKWNYRIVKYADGSGLGLHEVYYDENNRPCLMSKEPVRFTGESVSDVRMSLEAAWSALNRPVFEEPNEWRAKDNQKTEDGEITQITAEWLESIGFLQDGEDKGNKEYGKRAWSLSHLEDSDDDNANMIQVLVSAKDCSLWLEVYDNGGDSLALIEVPGGTQDRVLKLCEALGIKTNVGLF